MSVDSFSATNRQSRCNPRLLTRGHTFPGVRATQEKGEEENGETPAYHGLPRIRSASVQLSQTKQTRIALAATARNGTRGARATASVRTLPRAEKPTNGLSTPSFCIPLPADGLCVCPPCSLSYSTTTTSDGANYSLKERRAGVL